MNIKTRKEAKEEDWEAEADPNRSTDFMRLLRAGTDWHAGPADMEDTGPEIGEETPGQLDRNALSAEVLATRRSGAQMRSIGDEGLRK